MINSRVEFTKQKQSTTPIFPLLAEYISPGRSYIVLFISGGHGIVVQSNNSQVLVGTYNLFTGPHDKEWRVLQPNEFVVLNNTET